MAHGVHNLSCNPAAAWRAAQEIGPSTAARYVAYRIGMQIGWFRLATRIRSSEAQPLARWLRPQTPVEPDAYERYRRTRAERPQFFLDADPHRDLRGLLASRREAAVAEADEILAGQFRLFGGPPVSLGFPPDWAAFSPLEGDTGSFTVSLDKHWSEYTLDNLPSDVKLLWEVSRFGWVFPLVRAFWASGDGRYFDGFWSLLESWRQTNPPNQGPNWISGQEIALRLVAMCFAAHGFEAAFRGTPKRLVMLVHMVAQHAHRIPPTLIYARAQGNNHLLTEAAALYTAGLLFPEMKAAERWRGLGRRWLVEGLRTQIDPDGGYVQHSANYHRLMLCVGLWSARLAELNGDLLPTQTLEALGRATRFLAAMVDPKSGSSPNFGPNDGANVLPLSMSGFGDFRPVVQAAGRAFLLGSLLPPGPWDDLSLWLGLDPRLKPMGARADDRAASFPSAGLHFLRGDHAWAMLRCAHFRNRPGHADQLHLDLWWRGKNLALDPGTYLYSGRAPWDNGLMGAEVHNAVAIDGQGPMRRAGRFLWLHWGQAQILGRWCDSSGRLEAVSAEHLGYQRLGVRVRRCVLRAGDDLWLVVDDVLGSGEHRARVSWLVPDAPWRLEGQTLHLDLDVGAMTLRLEGAIENLGVYRAGEHEAGDPIQGASPVWGWFSPSYAMKTPALFLMAEASGLLPRRLVSRWTLAGADPESLVVRWRQPGDGSAPFTDVEFEGQHLAT